MDFSLNTKETKYALSNSERERRVSLRPLLVGRTWTAALSPWQLCYEDRGRSQRPHGPTAVALGWLARPARTCGKPGPLLVNPVCLSMHAYALLRNNHVLMDPATYCSWTAILKSFSKLQQSDSKWYLKNNVFKALKNKLRLSPKSCILRSKLYY